ncbi:hypothetical protein RhiirA4_430574 [Rhizophagus irregularis]|uniref:Uncharacterized protein n=1 Tax=Rhizophagus irregularis TaxID=588596 RepID=A0A2I1HLC4_9GLOM|nr:hypothetical protein RhiirA4_430574 [Rhizophagus irregularis]
MTLIRASSFGLFLSILFLFHTTQIPLLGRLTFSNNSVQIFHILEIALRQEHRNGHFQNCNFGGLLRIRKERNGLFFQNCDFGGWATKNMKETVSSFRTVISVGIISSFGIVIRYKGKWEAGVQFIYVWLKIGILNLLFEII